MLAAGTGSAVVCSASSSPPVVLSGELTVDPEKEGGVLKTFRNDFRPAAAKQPGFIDMRMLKVRPRANAPAWRPNPSFCVDFSIGRTASKMGNHRRSQANLAGNAERIQIQQLYIV
jgi:hypothetical protein